MGEANEVTISTAKFEIVVTESTLSNFRLFLDIMPAVQQRGTYHRGGNGSRHGGYRVFYISSFCVCGGGGGNKGVGNKRENDDDHDEEEYKKYKEERKYGSVRQSMYQTPRWSTAVGCVSWWSI